MDDDVPGRAVRRDSADLLLNVPFIPFGEGVAVAFWGVETPPRMCYGPTASSPSLGPGSPAGPGRLAQRLPNLALAGAIVVGLGCIAALTKPYSAPALIADRRWLQLGVAALVGVITIPLLPWFLFYQSRAIVANSFATFAGNPVSAAGSPLLIVAVLVALVSLGWHRGWALLAPGVLAQQPHYIVFSLETVVSSRILALAIPSPSRMPPVGVIAYALVERGRGTLAPTPVAVGPDPT